MFALIKQVKGLPPLAAVIVALIVGFGAGAAIKGKRTETVHVPVPTPVTQYVDRVDTLWLKQDVVRYITESRTDTVYVDSSAQWAVYSSTTVDLNTEDADYGSIDIEYIHAPWDEFHTTFYPALLPTEVRTIREVQYVPQTLRYYEKPWFNWAVGVGMGFVATRWYDAH